jgi:hypothetical protein
MLMFHLLHALIHDTDVWWRARIHIHANLRYAVTYPLFGPSVLVSTLLSFTLNMCSSLRAGVLNLLQAWVHIRPFLSAGGPQGYK